MVSGRARDCTRTVISHSPIPSETDTQEDGRFKPGNDIMGALPGPLQRGRAAGIPATGQNRSRGPAWCSHKDWYRSRIFTPTDLHAPPAGRAPAGDRELPIRFVDPGDEPGMEEETDERPEQSVQRYNSAIYFRDDSISWSGGIGIAQGTSLSMRRGNGVSCATPAAV